LLVPSSSSQAVAEVRDVNERSAQGADMGRISTADMIEMTKMVFGALNKGILSRAVSLKVPVNQVYIRVMGSARWKTSIV
jgi:hypothetical protein